MNLKHKTEAENIGLVLLDESPLIKNDGQVDFNYKRYKIVGCGHEHYFQPTHVRRGHVKCTDCLESDVKEELLQLGLMVKDKGTTANQVLIENLKCGHTYEIYKSNRKTMAIDSNCRQCYEVRIAEEAFNQGLQLLGSSTKGGTYRRYKFNSCGHEQDISSPCIPVGRYRCQQCKEDVYRAKAKLAGLEYLGIADNTKYDTQRRIYKLPCGHSKALRMDHAASGSYLCDHCDDSHYTKPSNVYLLEMQSGDFKWLKFGVAKDLQNRMSNYGLDGNIELIAIRTFDTGYTAISFERAVHKKFKKDRFPKSFMKKYLKNNGFTECYPLHFKEILLKEMNG